jgi:hypothetical protein
MGSKGVNIETILKRDTPPDVGAWGILAAHLLHIMEDHKQMQLRAEVRVSAGLPMRRPSLTRPLPPPSHTLSLSLPSKPIRLYHPLASF